MLSGLISCGKEPDKQPGDTAAPSAGSAADIFGDETAEDPNKGPAIAALLPNLDFEGAVVSIVMDYSSADYPPPEELTGSAVNDALVDRNRAVEELYNVTLDFSVFMGEPRETYPMWAEAGDDTYQLYTSRTRYVGEFITENISRSWSKYRDILDFEAEWFNTYAINTFAIGDDVRLLYGDANESSIRYAWIWLFNKELAEQYHLPDLYETVDEGKWTLDLLMTLTQDVYTDVNGDGKADGEDVYGYVSDNAASYDSWAPTFGLHPILKDENNMPVLVESMSEMTLQGCEKLYKLLFESQGTHIDRGEGPAFEQNGAVFHNEQIHVLEDDTIREMVDFGILPTPKLTEEQETYYTHTDCCFSCLLLPSPISAEEAVRSVYIANALNAFSHELVLPVYYETVLKTRLTRDRESPRMLDLALAGRRYGFEYCAEWIFPISHYHTLRGRYRVLKCPTVSDYTKEVDKARKWIKDFLLDWEAMVETEGE